MPLAFPAFTTAVPTVGTGITIAAQVWRWDGNSGAVRVSSGFPLQPGMLTAANANTFRVFVAGVEQAIALKPTDGWFPDGSYRSPGVQFLYDLTHDTPVAAEIRINQGVRGTSDIAWVEPTRVSVMKKAVIAPTDPVHLCKTMVTLTPLTPAANDTGTNATWAAYAESAWLGSAGISTGSNPGGAIYDQFTGLANIWCRTGNRLWYQRAYDWAVSFGGESGLYHNAASPGNGDAHPVTLLEKLLPSPGMTTCGTAEPTWNPEGLHNPVSTGDCGNPKEDYGYGRWISLCVMYWITAYRQFKRLIAINANVALWQTEIGYPQWRDRTSIWYGQRFNLRYLWAPVIAGYLTGCTTGMVGPGGEPAVTSWDYATYLDWIIDILEYWKWNRPSDYRNGLVGQRDTTIDVPDQPGHEGTGDHWGITNFQLSVMSEQLMLIYENILPDTRIPPMIKTICDYWITQIRPATPAENVPALWPTAAWMGAYDNLAPATVADTTFTATTLTGTNSLAWVTGMVHYSYLLPGHSIAAPNLPADTRITAVSGTTITLDQITSGPGTGTYQLLLTPYDIVMYAPTFAWYYAYSSTALYNTWATRASDNVVGMAAMAQLKNWAEVYGGTRQQFLFYRAGGAVRGIPGAHPTVIVNPPLQPTLG